METLGGVTLPKGVHLSCVDQMGWEPHVLSGSIRKVLDTDVSSGTYVHYRYTPPGAGNNVRQLHLSVNETFYFISGDLPFYEFNSPEDGEGRLVTFCGGTFMDRKPFSIHGRKLLPESKTGCTLLIWNSGGGEFEVDSSESIEIPFTGDMPSFNQPFTQPTVVNSNNMPWTKHPVCSDWKWRPLSTEANQLGLTSRPVAAVYIPPDWQTTKVNESISLPCRAWVFVLSGALEVEVADQQINLLEGSYLRWDPGIEQPSPRSASPVGCTLLCVGNSLAPE